MQSVLPLHECADPAPTESAATESPPVESMAVADPTPVECMAATNPAPAEPSTEPLHSATGAAPTETS
jgi:hypothetical protein